MILRGILDRSLSNQLCIRGFASIKLLANISEADDSYQRDLYGEQEEIVKRFLEREKFLFFPEVILSYKFPFVGDTSKNPFLAVKNIKQQTKNTISFKSNKDGTKFKVKRVAYKSQDLRGEEAIYIVELELEDEYISDINFHKLKRPFHRIDGNHRLTVAEFSDSEIVEKMVVPFCVILGEEYFDDKDEVIENEESLLFEKSIRVYFHNINTKSLPLTPEQNLRVIIDEKKLFSDDELQETFKRSGLLVRKICDKIQNFTSFKGLEYLLESNHRTILLDIFDCLDNYETNNEILLEAVEEAIQTVNELYKTEDNLKSNNNVGIFITLIYYCVTDKQKYHSFISWILQNHLFETDVNHWSLIEIFDKVSEQEFKVFVAMPYFDGDPETVAEYNDIYNSVIEKIGKDFGIKISLYEIMNNKGETQDQIQDIINKIQECKIFIADISGNNANVLYETGWARALKKPTLLFREEKSEKPKSDYANDTYHIYKNTSRNRSLSKIARENILEVLSKNYGVIIPSKK